jgi:hypothetical protein
MLGVAQVIEYLPRKFEEALRSNPSITKKTLRTNKQKDIVARTFSMEPQQLSN